MDNVYVKSMTIGTYYNILYYLMSHFFKKVQRDLGLYL